MTSKHRYSDIRERCERFQASVRRRAQQACREAGVGEINMCVIHNALISYREGKPWTEINYPALRRAAWLLDKRMYAASECLRRLYERKGYEAFIWS